MFADWQTRLILIVVALAIYVIVKAWRDQKKAAKKDEKAKGGPNESSNH